MKAMILAAGFGTRLRPLTDIKPKALVPFGGVPMVEGVIRKLANAGINEIIVNVHHFAGDVIAFLKTMGIPGIKIYISDESEELMDTGGAILKARDFLLDEKAFLIHNVDVYSSLDISALIDAHYKDDCLVSIAVKKRSTSRSLLFNRENLLAGWRNNETGEELIISREAESLQDFGNSCVQVINSELLDYYPDTKPLSLTKMYLDLAPQHKIRAYVHNEDYWFDLGRFENFQSAEKELF